MYFKYPYSDMYALNLDWMIKAINEVQDIIDNLGNVVNSVNGESGDVTISAEMVNATDINGTLVTANDPSNQPQNVLAAYYGNGIRVILVRNTLGVIDRCFFLSKSESVYNLVEYVPADPQAGVRLINGLSGDVTLTGENIMLSAEDQRTIAVVVAALNNRVGTVETNVGDLSNLETYNKASLVAAINELVQTDNTIFEDIGDISELEVEAGNVVAAVNNVNEQIAAVQDALAIIANGDVHSYIANGQFVYVKNHDANNGFSGTAILAEGLYRANGNIAVNYPLTTSDLNADSSGGLNALKNLIDLVGISYTHPELTLHQSTTYQGNVTFNRSSFFKFGRICILTSEFKITTAPTSVNNDIIMITGLPYRPDTYMHAFDGIVRKVNDYSGGLTCALTGNNNYISLALIYPDGSFVAANSTLNLTLIYVSGE